MQRDARNKEKQGTLFSSKSKRPHRRLDFSGTSMKQCFVKKEKIRQYLER